MKVIIIGGVAGGASCAARLRRLNEEAKITIYERTGYISYANCGLPYYIGDVIKDKNNLTIQTPKSFNKRFNIDVKVKHEVIKIDILNKQVLVKDLLTENTFYDTYDKLVLSCGAKAKLPPFYKESSNVFTVRTVEDTYKIKEFIDVKKPLRATIIGGGYIGVEMAENLHNLGIRVSLVQSNKQLLKIIDYDLVSFVHSEIRSKGIKLYLGKKVSNVVVDDVITTYLEDGCKIESDMIIYAIGVTPDSKLAQDANLELGVNNSVKVNSHMLTSDTDIYAVGDMVEVKHFITKKDVLISLAGPANKQGRVAADNICGIPSEFKYSLGSSIIKVFDLDVAKTGLTEKECIDKGYNYDSVILTPASHATYYPNAKVLTLKVIYNKDNKEILGAQAVGYDGVDKRIDVLATAIKCKMKATELKDLELAYAPPYSSAKDPVNMAGFIIDNIENNIVKQFSYEEIKTLRTKDDVILLDTRTEFEYKRGHAEDFINIPLDDLRSRLDELDKSKSVYVMCQSGLRSYLATRILTQHGFDSYNFIGGYRLYSSIYNDEKLIKESYDCGMDRSK